jgi:hypothetical protein
MCDKIHIYYYLELDIRWLVGFVNVSELNPTIRIRYVLPVVVFIGVVDFDAISPGFCGLRLEQHDVGRKIAFRLDLEGHEIRVRPFKVNFHV